MELMKRKNGITLVSLVITIVILIILATVSINAIFGESGLVGNAEDAKFRQEKAEAQERLSLVLADAYTEKITTTEYTQEEFLNEHLEEFVYEKESDAEIFNEEGIDYISLNGFIFILDRSVPELGEYDGTEQNRPPVIRKIDVISKTDTSATIEVTVARAEEASFRYSIKKSDEGDESYIQETTKSENTNKFTGLEKTGTYTIYTAKVELLKDGAVVDIEYKEILIGKLDQEVVRFIDGKWENGKVSVQILTDEKEYKLQYQIVEEDSKEINNDKWMDITSGSRITGIIYGQTVYGRLWNGIDESAPAKFIVEDIVEPTITNIDVLTSMHSIIIKLEAQDLESGIAKIEYSKDDGLNYLTGITDIDTQYEFANLTENTLYKIKIRITDYVGNILIKELNRFTKKDNKLFIQEKEFVINTTYNYWTVYSTDSNTAVVKASNIPAWTSNCAVYFRSLNKINLKDVNKIILNLKSINGNHGNIEFGISKTEEPPNNGIINWSKYIAMNATNYDIWGVRDSERLFVDTSDLDDEYYIWIRTWISAGGAEAEIASIEF